MSVGFLGGKFLPCHEGHVFSIVQAASQVDKLYVVLSSSKLRDMKICETDGCKYMSTDLRMAWLGWMTRELPNVQVINIEDNSEGYEKCDWVEGAKLITAAIPEHIDYIFSSEPEYGPIFRECYPTSKHIVVDEGKNIVPISATQIRKNIFENWEYLPPIVRKFFVKKVLISGTESCGKSTLTQKLAMRYNTTSVKEVGRDFCEYYSNNLTEKIFEEIAMRHALQIGERCYKANKVLFIDSDAVITQYYMKMYLNKTSELINQIALRQEFDAILYLQPDVKWVDDGYRFKGDQDERLHLNSCLLDMYANYGYNNLFSISGNYSERYNKACSIIDEL